ncbi:hypothetical protein chiPu_0031074, partial [Chiloscyllium punctatum]|nr:hypothetical protein [Chiloscyllium punctatum]
MDYFAAIAPRNDGCALFVVHSRRRARLHQLVEHRIHQRLERGVDDIGRDADRGPALAGLVLAFDQNPRDRLGAAIEDTHAVVDQLQAIDVLLVLAEVLAQRDVERIDRAIAFGGRDQMLAVDIDLHHRERHGHTLAVGVVALLDIDVELLDLKIFRYLAERAARQQIEGC